MGFLAGKRILITGLLSKPLDLLRDRKSHAPGRCRTRLHLPERTLSGTCHQDGCRIRQLRRYIPATCRATTKLPVSSIGSASSGTVWTGWCIPSPLHPSEALEGDFLESASREAFRISQEISAYSFPALGQGRTPADEGPQRGDAHHVLPGRSTYHAQLQHHGSGQSQS
jgi:enoyl-[acyl-carrier protein] reductase I